MVELIEPSRSLQGRLQWLRSKRFDEPIWPNGPTPAQYIDGFVRPAGSYVTGDWPGDGRMRTQGHLLEFFDDLDAMRADEILAARLPAGVAKPGCRYFAVTVPKGYKAYKAALLADELTEVELESVRLRRGPHGLDLVSTAIAPIETVQVTLVEDQDGLVTWHPGAPLAGTVCAVVKLI